MPGNPELTMNKQQAGFQLTAFPQGGNKWTSHKAVLLLHSSPAPPKKEKIKSEQQHKLASTNEEASVLTVNFI